MIGRTVGRIGLSLFLFLTVVAAARTEEPSPAATKKLAPGDIQKLIDQLGDEKFAKREQAMRQLRALGEEALDAVEKALRSEDAEVRNRADKLAVDLRHIRRERLYRAMAEKIKDLPLDQFIDHMATRKEFDKPENWDRLYDIAKVLSQRAEMLADRKWPLPNLNYKTFPTDSGKSAVRYVNQKIRADGIDRRISALQNCVLVSSGNVQYITSIVNSIVFIEGDLEACTSIIDSFVVCNGSLGRSNIIRNSVLLTTGDFVGSTRADQSFFQVKSVGRHTVASQNVYLNLDSVASANSTNNRFIQNEKGPLQSVIFFKPSLLGIEISKSDGRVRIDKVAEGKPFARAGLRAGDIITAAEGGDVSSVEALNRILRRRLPYESIILKIRREDKTVEVKVRLPQ
jgi:hypothetical protein